MRSISPPEISIHALLAESDWRCLREWQQFPGISIHALLAESDPSASLVAVVLPYFYPRSPCGERPGAVLAGCAQARISIHALLAESDLTVQFK